jgi:hypothetical protein
MLPVPGDDLPAAGCGQVDADHGEHAVDGASGGGVPTAGDGAVPFQSLPALVEQRSDGPLRSAESGGDVAPTTQRSPPEGGDRFSTGCSEEELYGGKGNLRVFRWMEHGSSCRSDIGTAPSGLSEFRGLFARIPK